MTLPHLMSAVAVGVVVGVIGIFVMPAGRRVPGWVPVAAAVAAALLATITARIADSGPTGFGITELVMQVVFAAAGITLIAGTADRQPARHGNDGPTR